MDTGAANAQKARRVHKFFDRAFGKVNAFTGVCILDPVSGKYIFQLNSDRYFTPASNTKIYSLYTGLNYLGDFTTGLKYKLLGDTLYIQGTGDPSLLDPDYPTQPAIAFLQHQDHPIVLTNPVDENEIFGPGWAWDDYSADYQPERSAMPLYGNVVWCSVKDRSLQTMPFYFQKNGGMIPDDVSRSGRFRVHRDQEGNIFRYETGTGDGENILPVPFPIATPSAVT